MRDWTSEQANRRLTLVGSGELGGNNGVYEKRVADLVGIYDDTEAFERAAADNGDELAYRVEEYRPSANPGDIIVGTSSLEPGRIGREFFMTRGHLHAVVDRPEIYHCIDGHGVMLTEDAEGVVEAIEMHPGTIVYVAPGWVHRTVNVGSSRFTTVFSYPADAGQNYDVIADTGGMALLVVDDGEGGWTTIANPNYRPRT